MTSIRLQDIERRGWRAMSSENGLMDILFGFMLLGACLSEWVGLGSVPDWLRIVTLSGTQFGGVGIIFLMRKRYVEPRIGHAKFSARRERRRRTLRIILAICVAITVVLVVLTSLSGRFGFSLFGPSSEWTVWITISAVVLIPIGALAIFLDHPRLVLHGSLFVIAEFCLVILGWGDGAPFIPALLFGIGSLISFSIGIPIYCRFLRTTPSVIPGIKEDSHE